MPCIWSIPLWGRGEAILDTRISALKPEPQPGLYVICGIHTLSSARSLKVEYLALPDKIDVRESFDTQDTLCLG